MSVLLHLSKSLGIVKSGSFNEEIFLNITQALEYIDSLNESKAMFTFQRDFILILLDVFSTIDMILNPATPYSLQKSYNQMIIYQNAFIDVCVRNYGMNASSRRLLSFYAYLCSLIAFSIQKGNESL